MNFDTDVLIVGAGPTGLMMASQLLRFGIRFRIIDKQADRAHESRAFAIQAKSMEILQNLGLVSEFLKVARPGVEVAFYASGKKIVTFKFGDSILKDTPFPNIYFLPQSETERILIEHLEKNGILIDRETELLSLTQTQQLVDATIKNNRTGQVEKISCRYLVGCDGAHSTVRHALNLTFEGAPYEQEFILADVKVNWPYSSDNFTFFTSKKGILLNFPFSQDLSRIIIARGGNSGQKKLDTPSLEEVTQLATEITDAPIKLSNAEWITRFHLHHRGVDHYRQGRAFVAGDAAHIHSPVGGQGMNTGLQDATNLAWKLALVIKKISSDDLLNTYETERHRIGQILLKTTDRLFIFVTSNNFIISSLRSFVLPLFFKFLFSKHGARNRLFRFISQLAIHYHDSPFVWEVTTEEDSEFKTGPQAGYRAPDAPGNNTTLYELLKNSKSNILIFCSNATNEIKLKKLENSYQDLIRIHQFNKNSNNNLLFQRYGVSSEAVYFIRPDGYIGFRSYGPDLKPLEEYLKKLFSY